ncbi:MAG: nuclease [Bacteriovoracaceae bacterium]|jgi:deoxyribonuclease I|nr:nuclease [Bacteriovoracaceae bacterium]
MNLLKRVFICSFFLISASVSANGLDASDHYYGSDFYHTKRTLKESSLKRAIQKIHKSYHQKVPGNFDTISDGSCHAKGCYKHKVFQYRESRKHLLSSIHLEGAKNNYYIKGVYCEKNYTKSDFSRGKGPGPIQPPDHQVLNVEHTWPQSRFSSTSSHQVQKTDLHHLYPTDSLQNSQRGSFKFAEVYTETKNTTCSQNKLGYIDPTFPAKSDHYSIYFEPTDSHKGNVARAIFYFSVTYNIKIDAVEEHYLRKWHLEDPVDNSEIRRHEMIFTIQGSRNTFIDYPELVDQISNF